MQLKNNFFVITLIWLGIYKNKNEISTTFSKIYHYLVYRFILKSIVLNKVVIRF